MLVAPCCVANLAVQVRVREKGRKLKDGKAQKLKDGKARKLKDEKARQALLVEAARNLEKSSVISRSRSSRRSILSVNATDSQKSKQPQSNNDASDAELVVPKKPAAKEKSTAKEKPVLSKKRKQAASKGDSEKSSPNPVGTNKRTNRTPANPRANLIILNPTAKNTDVVKGYKLQIKVSHTV